MYMEVGCEVLTPYGWGILKAKPAPERFAIELDDWDLAGKATPMLYASSSAIIRTSMYDIGTCLLTKYGLGILFEYRRDTDMFCVRLWRPFGEGCSTAHMSRNEIIKRTSTITGARVKTPYGLGVVDGFQVSGPNKDIMFSVRLPFGTAHMNEQSVESIQTIVMPAADYLMNRMSKSMAKTSKLKELGEQFLGGHAGKIPVVQSMKNAWEQLTNGDTNVNELVKGRAAQLKQFVQKYDAKELEHELQEQVVNKLGHTGQLQTLLTEGRNRVIELIQSADQRKELGESTKDQLNNYLKLGISQVDTAIGVLKQEAKPDEMKIIDGVIRIKDDVEDSISVLKDVAQTDPVLQDIMKRIEQSTAEAKARSDAITSQFRETRAMKTLSDGADHFTNRVEGLMNSADSGRIKDLGSRVLKSIGKQGEEKGRELVDDLKNRVLKHLSKDEQNESIMKKIENRMLEELNKWKEGSYQEYSNVLAEGVTSLTFLLGVISEGNMNSTNPKEMLHVALSKSSVTREFASSPTAFMWRKLVDMLMELKEREEIIRKAPLTGFEFTKQFKMPPSVAARRALTKYAKPEVDRFTKIITAQIDPKYQDAAAPISALVGQIASGSFNLESAIEAAKQSLNSSGMTNAAEELIASGDKVVGALEAFSNSDSVQLAMLKLQEMDIERSVSAQLNKFNTKSVLDQAEEALSNSEARNRIINNTKDQILEFLLENLPSMSVPDIQGIKDDVQFAVTGLDMSGFKLRKEDVIVELGSDLQDEFLTCTATGIMAKFARVRWRYQQLYFPYLSGGGHADASVENASIRLGLKLVRVPKGVLKTLRGSNSSSDDKTASGAFKMPADPTAADEENFYRLFPNIRQAVESIRAGEGMLNDLIPKKPVLGVEQTLPPVKPPAAWGDVTEWEPALVLSGRYISMQNLELNIENSTLAWLYNLLASVFAGLIKEYVCNSLKDVIGSHSAMLLGSINAMTSSYWPFIKKILSVTIEGLPIASNTDVAALMGPPIADRPVEMIPREYILKFSESGTLGLKMHMFKEEQPVSRSEIIEEGTSSPSPSVSKTAQSPEGVSSGCRAVITGIVPGTQAERVLKEKSLLAYYINSTIIAVNGKNTKSLDEDGVLALLRGARPLFISIRLERKIWVSMGQNKLRSKPTASKLLGAAAASPMIGGAKLIRSATGSGDELQAHKRRLKVVTIRFENGPLGLKLKETRSCGGAVIITGFARGGDDGETILQAEASGRLFVGMLMLTVGGEVVFGRPFDEIMAVVKAAARPTDMAFVHSPDKQLVFQEIPRGMLFGRIEEYMMLTAFTAEATARGPLIGVDYTTKANVVVQPGIIIMQVNQTKVTPDTASEEVTEMITNSATPLKIAVRDMDAFMHLIRIRDGKESASEVEELTSPL